jgi:hypothetical protein|nr:MAG TPA: copper resistance protein [Caudoviricetes sp.]
MSLQEKLDYLEMINDMVLNYVKDNPDVADFLLKNKTVKTDKETGLSVAITLNKNMEEK